MTSAGHFGEDGTTVVPDTLTGRASIDLAAQKIVKWNTNSNSVKAIPTEDIIVNDATANAIYLAGFSKDGITKEIYEKSIIILRKI